MALVPATPNITWDSIGPFESIRPKIKESIITSIQIRAPAVLSIDCSNATNLSEGRGTLPSRTGHLPCHVPDILPHPRHRRRVALRPPRGRGRGLENIQNPRDRQPSRPRRVWNDNLLSGTNAVFFFSRSSVLARFKVSLVTIRSGRQDQDQVDLASNPLIVAYTARSFAVPRDYIESCFGPLIMSGSADIGPWLQYKRNLG